MEDKNKKFILWFDDIGKDDIPLVGGKNANLGEMIGWRGANRYTDPNFSQAFALECQVVQKVRNDMGLRNLQVMIPLCRTPE